MKAYDVIILGAGAAGLMCALTAGQRGKSVLVIERANKVGKKILMSGGGRCNFTNLYIEANKYLSNNPHFFKSALNQYTQWDFIAMVEAHGVDYHEKEEGQLFCDVSSKLIVNMLLDECEKVGVVIETNRQVTQVRATESEAAFDYEVITEHTTVQTNRLVIATGGLSIPKMGGSGFGYQVAEQFGLNVLPLTAGLVPFTFTDEYQKMFSELSGTSIEVDVEIGKQSFNNQMLFTHRGLSGPSILQISSYWQPGAHLKVDLCPEYTVSEWLLAEKKQQPKSSLMQLFSTLWPKKLSTLFFQYELPGEMHLRLQEISDNRLLQIGQHINAWLLKPAATEGYRTAEVTLGGVDTQHLSSQTMECKSHPGLYFIGEVVDVTGHLGGFNFQWAWSSGYVAGRAV